MCEDLMSTEVTGATDSQKTFYKNISNCSISQNEIMYMYVCICVYIKYVTGYIPLLLERKEFVITHTPLAVTSTRLHYRNCHQSSGTVAIAVGTEGTVKAMPCVAAPAVM